MVRKERLWGYRGICLILHGYTEKNTLLHIRAKHTRAKHQYEQQNKLFSFWDRPNYVDQVNLESSCLELPSAGITSLCRQALLQTHIQRHYRNKIKFVFDLCYLQFGFSFNLRMGVEGVKSTSGPTSESLNAWSAVTWSQRLCHFKNKNHSPLNSTHTCI